MNHSETTIMKPTDCGSKTICFDWQRKKDHGYCKGCMFHIPNYSKQETDLSQKESKKATEGFLRVIDNPSRVQDELRAREIRDELKEKYPHGHHKFLDLALDEIRLHSDKNHDFAKGGNPLGNFNRVGAILDLYPGLKPGDPIVVAVAFMLKQLDASLWMYSQGTKAKIEGHTERWRDIAVYAKIISILIRENQLE